MYTQTSFNFEEAQVSINRDTPTWEIAAERANEIFGYGSTIERAWLDEAFGLTVPTYGTKKDFDDYAFDFMDNMEKFRGYLLEVHQKFLSNVRGTGYLVVTPQDQTKVKLAEFNRKINQEFGKAVKVLSNVNMMMLDDASKRENFEAQGRLSSLRMMMKNSASKA